MHTHNSSESVSAAWVSLNEYSYISMLGFEGFSYLKSSYISLKS